MKNTGGITILVFAALALTGMAGRGAASWKNITPFELKEVYHGIKR